MVVVVGVEELPWVDVWSAERGQDRHIRAHLDGDRKNRNWGIFGRRVTENSAVACIDNRECVSNLLLFAKSQSSVCVCVCV